MCAINGVTKHDEALVARMNAATRHRGPDGTGIVAEQGITLGHNRLAIIDLSEAGAQPMRSHDGRVAISFNGEIYNYRELRSELAATYPFRSQSDTEVLLAAYQRWGIDMLARLRGIFAFALWDRNERSLYLVRDQMGVKPLYFTQRDEHVYFSSELGGVLAALPSAPLDRDAALLYLALQYAPNPRSLVAGVEKLAPGEYALVTKYQVSRVRYFKPEVGEGMGEPGEDLVATIDRVVTRQLVSDRPVGLYLSGGFDSSIVLHHASKKQQDLDTYAVDFEMVAGAESEASKFNTDADLAERTAHTYGAHHTRVTLSLSEIRAEFEEIFMNADEPVANPTLLPQYLLSRAVREKGTVVVLGGNGGDELFGGYGRHRALVSAYLYQRALPRAIRAAMARGRSGRLVRLNEPVPETLHARIVAAKEPTLRRVLRDPTQEPGRLVEEHVRRLYEHIPTEHHPLERFLLADRATWLPDEALTRVDHATMAHGIELRVPLLDLDLVATADRISVWKKTTPWQGKRVLRNAYRGLLPDYLYKEPKRGWESPGAKWLRDSVIRKTVAVILSDGYYDGLSSFIDWDAARAMHEEHCNGGYHLYPLWNLVQLQVWARHAGVRADRS